MTFIDADTHIEECDDTWSYIPATDRDLTPSVIEFTADQGPAWLRQGPGHTTTGDLFRFWFIDGKLFPHRKRIDEFSGTTHGTRTLSDVPGRLRDMDELKLEHQVIFPTLFINEPSLRQDILVTLYRSYNRWLADRCAESKGRLRWVAMIPYVSMPDALEEIRFASEHGAVGIHKLGVDSGRLAAGDPYFLPAYRLAAELDLAVCIHTGTPWAPVEGRLSSFEHPLSGPVFPVIEAFGSLMRARLAGRLPDNLRVGFLEAGATWLPLVLGNAGWTWNTEWSDRDHSFSELGFFVACLNHEDLPYLLNVVGGDDNIVIGTDYTHADKASVMDAHLRMLSRDDIDPASAVKITSENARELYHF